MIERVRIREPSAEEVEPKKDGRSRNGNPAFGKGQFKGRQRGTVNKTTRELREGILDSAVRLGYDGKGKDGLVGFLMMLGEKWVPQYVTLLAKIIPHEINANKIIKVYDIDDALLNLADDMERAVIQSLMEKMQKRRLSLPSPVTIDADASDYAATLK